MASMLDRQCPVVVNGEHPPTVAVLHPVPAGRHHQPAGVATGTDLVTDRGDVAVAEGDPVGGNLAGEHPVCPGPGIQLRDRPRAGSEKDAVTAFADVGRPGGVRGVRNGVRGAGDNSLMVYVEVDGRPVSVADLKGRWASPESAKRTT